eukprot:1313555-Lingulodinium_polyedra.AAC.1
MKDSCLDDLGDLAQFDTVGVALAFAFPLALALALPSARLMTIGFFAKRNFFESFISTMSGTVCTLTSAGVLMTHGH